jgi:hypothetical protein
MGTKEEYQERVQSELETSGAQIEAWSAKAERSEGKTKIEYEERLDLLREIHGRAQASLDELKQAGDEPWEDVRARLDGVLSELRNAILNISLRLQ